MTTTQTQVTGPVDDAIDAELAELISLSHVTNTWEHKRDRLVRSLNARLAPRAPMPDSEVDDITKAIVSLFDAEVKL